MTEHIHEASYQYSIATSPVGDTYAVERGTCECGAAIHRPVLYGMTKAQTTTRYTLTTEELDHRTAEGRKAAETVEAVDPLADEKELLARVTDGLAEARGRLYPTCSAWAFAKVAADANLSERGELSQAQRFLLFVMAADADRALNSPNGYSGTPLDRLLSLTRLGRILVFMSIESLLAAGLIEEIPTDQTRAVGVAGWRLPERFLAYMRD